MNASVPAGVGPVVVTPLGGSLGLWRAGSPSLCTLVFVRGGVGYLRANGVEIPLATGDAIVLAPYTQLDEHGLAGLAGYLVDVRECALGTTWMDADPAIMAAVHGLPLQRGRAPSARESACVVRLSAEECGEWDARLGRLSRELAQRGPGYEDVLRADLTVLLIDYARRIGAQRGYASGSATRPLVGEVLRYINANYRRPIALADVAKAVGRSRAYLTQLVHRETGRTVGDWIQVRRLAEARRLLLTTESDGAEVARAVSFTDPSYFIRLFRRYHGATPAEWRAAHRPAGGARDDTRVGPERARGDISADSAAT